MLPLHFADAVIHVEKGVEEGRSTSPELYTLVDSLLQIRVFLLMLSGIKNTMSSHLFHWYGSDVSICTCNKIHQIIIMFITECVLQELNL